MVLCVESLPHYPRVAQLWEFLQVLLNDSSEYYSDIIRWQNSFEGIFKIVDSARLAELWGQHKNLTGMTYDKMSRSLRNYYKTNKLKKVTGQRQVYQFIFSEKNPPFKSTHLSPKISRLIEETDSFKVKNNALYQEKLEIMHKNLQSFLAHRNPRRSDTKNTVSEKASVNPATASKVTDLALDIEVKEETQIK